MAERLEPGERVEDEPEGRRPEMNPGKPSRQLTWIIKARVGAVTPGGLFWKGPLWLENQPLILPKMFQRGASEMGQLTLMWDDWAQAGTLHGGKNRVTSRPFWATSRSTCLFLALGNALVRERWKRGSLKEVSDSGTHEPALGLIKEQ